MTIRYALTLCAVLLPRLCLSQAYTGCGGQAATGKLQLSITSLNAASGLVQINGADNRQPNTAFSWNWGDGVFTQGFFPRTHTYANVQQNYTLQVTSHENDGTSDCAEIALPFTAANASPSSVTLGASPAPSSFGHVVALTGTVTPAAAGGTVAFYDGTAFLGSAAVSGGTAVLNTMAIPAGTRSLRAHYSGDSTHAGSSSAVLTQVVQAGLGAGFLQASHSPFAAGNQPWSVAVGDFNGDGKADLALADWLDNSVAVLLGDGSGGFAPAPGSPFPTGYSPRFVVVADFNGDGKADLALADEAGLDVTVLLGNGSGGFTPAAGSPFPGGIFPHSLAVGDFNGDGKADLAVAGSGSSSLTVLLGNGTGGFTAAGGSPFAAGADPESVAVGDFNGDGQADLAIVNGSAGAVTILLGNGNGGFAPSPFSPIPVGTNPLFVAVGDFNADGRLDLAVVGDSLTILLGDGNGGFITAAGAPSGAGGYAVAVGDFNGDGKQDLVIAGSAVNVWLGNGTAGFTLAGGSPFLVSPGLWHAAAVGDFNGDGTADLALASVAAPSVTVLLGSGSAALTIGMTHVGNFAKGQTGATYSVTVSNQALGSATFGPVTVTETTPPGLTLISMSGDGWACPAGGNTCTRGDVLAGGNSYPAITVTVNVAGNATSPQVNQVGVSGGGSAGATTTDSTLIVVQPVLAIALSHDGNFTQGQNRALYTASVRNGSGMSTSGTVTVTALTPAGLSLVSMSGTGWNCLGATTCTRDDVLATGAAFPALTITVSVASDAPAQVINQASVSGGGSPLAVAADPTNIVAAVAPTTATAWGSNAYGQLGNGTLPYHTTPAQVGGLTGVIAASAGSNHGLAVKNDGTVWSWGDNGASELGNGTYNKDSGTPVQVSLLTGVVSVAAGSQYSLAVKNDGTVWAWGATTAIDSSIPQPIATLTGVSAVAGGYYHALAVKNDGTAWAWGDNSNGDLGNGSTTPSDTPVQVSGLTGVKAVAGGYDHSLALKNDGTVWAWGGNSLGQLGNGGAIASSTPVQVSGLSGIVSIAAGSQYSLAAKNDGTVWAWGHNFFGQLGNGTTTDSSTPVQVSGLSGAVKVAIGATGAHSMALKNDGTVWAWGGNEVGQLGNGTATRTTTPVQVSGLAGIGSIAAGSDFSLALKSDGTLWAWGGNEAGQLGDGVVPFSSIPSSVAGLPAVAALSSGEQHNLALKPDGTVWAWGSNVDGELGNNTVANSATPIQVGSLSGVTGISAGAYFSLAVKNDGTVWAWGWSSGGLGNGSIQSATPVQVSGLSGVVAVAAGIAHSLALKSDGTVWAWGDDSLGELGNGTTTGSGTPVQVSGLAGVTAIAVGSWNSFALKSDGTVWAWGDNSRGGLGNGTTVNSSTPVQVSGLAGVGAIAGSLALKNDGTVWAWGANNTGQLGVGTYTNSSTPVQVSGLSGVVAIAGGDLHALAEEADGSVWAWGLNSYGELGNGTAGAAGQICCGTIPVRVSGITRVSSLAAGGSSLAGPAPAAPVLSILSMHTGNFTQGQSGTYTLTVSNGLFAPAVGSPVTVTDTVPPGMLLVSLSGDGWTCPVGGNTCSRGDVLAGGNSYPAITVTVTVAGNATSPQVNQASVSGGGSAGATTTDSTIIRAAPFLGITLSHTGNFTEGQPAATYTVTVSNLGAAPTSGTVTVAENAPNGLTLVSMAGTNWTCTTGATVCTRSDVLGPGLAYPPITVTFSVDGGAAAQVVNQVAVSGGGAPGANAADITTINPAFGTLVPTPNPSTFGQTVNLTVTFKQSTSTGLVTFYDGTTVLGSAPVVLWRACQTCYMLRKATLNSIALPAGTRSLWAYYGGDGANSPGASAVVTQVVKANPGTGFLQPAGSPLPAGLSPYSVAVGDFNNDGKADLAIANYGANNVTVLLGNGAGGFAAAPGSPFPAGSEPSALIVADFNSDGYQDLAVANSASNNVTLLLGNGSGGFTPAAGSPLTVGTDPLSLVAGDFNGDGKVDLAVANYIGNNLTVLLGDGNGGFSPAAGSPFAAGHYPISLAVGDFNGDGKADLAIANLLDDTVTLLVGNGNGGFSPAAGSPFAAGWGPISLAAGDFNGDGKTDLAVADNGGSDVTVLLGNGNAGFTPSSGGPFAAGDNTFFVSSGDFNGDGITDLAVANSHGRNVTVLLGDGSGRFAPAPGSPFSVGSGPTSLAVGDFNGDGIADLAVANSGATNVTILLASSVPVLTVSSTHTGNFTPGQAGAYSLVVSNTAWAGPSTGTVTVTETAPAGVTVSAMGGDGWTCPSGGNTCTRDDALAGGKSYPAITVTVSVANNALPSLVNQVSVSGGGSAAAGATDPTAVVYPAPVLTGLSPASAPAKSPNAVILAANGSNFYPGSTIQWTPPGGGSPLTLSTTYAGSLQLQAAIPVSLLAAPGTAQVTILNPGGVSSGQLPFTLASVPILSLALSHTGNFVQGQIGATYTLIVTNGGVAPTSQPVTVTEMVPLGFTLVSMAGDSWTCPQGGNTCTRSAALAPGTSYSITVTVNVGGNSLASVTNQASLAGGGSASAAAADPTTVQNPCDVNQSGSTTALDVRQMVNEILGLAPAVHELTGSRMETVADLQIVMNSALSLGCFGSSPAVAMVPDAGRRR